MWAHTGNVGPTILLTLNKIPVLVLVFLEKNTIPTYVLVYSTYQVTIKSYLFVFIRNNCTLTFSNSMKFLTCLKASLAYLVEFPNLL